MGADGDGHRQAPGRPPCPEVMLESLVTGARSCGVDFLLAAGDISAEAVPIDLSQAGRLLGRFGTYGEDYFVTRGNHDRAHDGDPWSTCRAGQTAAILADYAATPGMFLHHAGHTHRTVSPLAPGVTHQEVAAGKEYPGGFALLRLHTGGFALNFYKCRSDLAREWSERSRQEILGLWPQFSLGASVADRNSVVCRDLSGLRPMCQDGVDQGQPAPPAGSSITGGGGGELPPAAAVEGTARITG